MKEWKREEDTPMASSGTSSRFRFTRMMTGRFSTFSSGEDEAAAITGTAKTFATGTSIYVCDVRWWYGVVGDKGKGCKVVVMRRGWYTQGQLRKVMMQKVRGRDGVVMWWCMAVRVG
jgi:hypothetical protein